MPYGILLRSARGLEAIYPIQPDNPSHGLDHPDVLVRTRTLIHQLKESNPGDTYEFLHRQPLPGEGSALA